MLFGGARRPERGGKLGLGELMGDELGILKRRAVVFGDDDNITGNRKCIIIKSTVLGAEIEAYRRNKARQRQTAISS